MPGILEDIDVLVVPSTWIENAPFIIREAFAAGVPVIASNLGGMAEMVRDGVDGLLFPAGDPAALAAAVRRLIDEPDLLARLRAGIRRPMAIEQDAAWLREVYVRAGAKERRAAVAGSRDLDASSQQRAASNEKRAAADLAAVILNYRTADQTYLAARSLQSSFSSPGEILIVDNHSEDGSAASLQHSLKNVRVIDSRHNLGFAGGCNIGIRAALQGGARFVLLVNSDAVLAPDAISALLRAVERHADIGIAGPVLLSREEPDRVSSAGISFSLRTGRMRHRAAGRRFSALGSAQVRRVDAISGCVMLIRREVVSTIGLLDETYFFSFEDVDFCIRACDAGFASAIVGAARVHHEGHRTIGHTTPARLYFAARNHLMLARRHSGSSLPFGLTAVPVITFNLAHAVRTSGGSLPARLAAVCRGTWDYAMGRFGAGAEAARLTP
jgi:GT2 family glycosyltransferase